MAQGWASLGGFGNVNATGSMPFGRANGTGALGMIAQALLTRGSMGQGAAQPQPTGNPQDDEELARALMQAFGGVMPPQAPMPNPGMRGY